MDLLKPKRRRKQGIVRKICERKYFSYQKKWRTGDRTQPRNPINFLLTFIGSTIKVGLITLVKELLVPFAIHMPNKERYDNFDV